MGWPHVPADWVSSFTAGTHSAPTVEVRALEEGVAWHVITDSCELKSCDEIETKVDYFSFGGTSKAKDIRIKFVDDDGAGNRGTYFDSSSNVAAGFPILVRITFGSTYRTVFSGCIMRIEQGDDASATLICREWLSWWLDNHSLDSYWAYTPDEYVTKMPHAHSEELRGGGSCFLNKEATNAERLTSSDVTDYAENWPATFSIWSDKGMPAAWLDSGQITSNRQSTVDAIGGVKDYYSDWSHALTIYSRPKSFYTNDWLHARETKGVNWVGGAEVPKIPGEAWEGQSNGDRTLFSISPPYLSYGSADQAFTLKSHTGSTVETGGVALIGPDVESYDNDDDGSKKFTWVGRAAEPKHLAHFSVRRQDDGDTQNGYQPHDNFNDRLSQDYKDERNCPMFGDARETWYHEAPGTEGDPWAFACYSPSQRYLTGNPDLKIPDSDRQQYTRRSNFINNAFSILEVLGGYKRPPVPEIDGGTEYDLQDGFTSTALEANGYAQTTSAGGVSPLRLGVLADYLEDGSRIPALNRGLLSWKIGLADDVMQPGTKYRKLVDAICKVVGVWIIQSPFGQIDFQLARPLADSSGGDFYHSGVTVPTFRASTAADEPNIDQDSGDRNAWKIKWKEQSEKTVKSCVVEWNTIETPEVGLTTLKTRKGIPRTSYGGYTASGEKEVTHKVDAVLINAASTATDYIKAYGEPLTEIGFESALRFFSDDRDRTSGTDCFLRMGRPINVQDTDHARGGDAVITGIRLNVTKGTMGLTAITGDSRAVDEHCWPEDERVIFDSTGVGNSTDKTVTFTNDGIDAISGTVSLDGSPGDFSIISGATYTTLAAGSSHDVVVRFTPLESGVYAGKLDLGGDADAGTGCINTGGAPYVTLIASAFELPICMSDGEIDFGQFYINYAKDITFKVWNYGTGSLDGYVEFPAEDDAAEFALVSGATEYNAPSTTDIALGGLTGGESKSVKVRFRPSAATQFEAHLNLNADVRCACGGGIDTIVLKGEGIPLPDCFVTNQSMNFGTIKAGASSGDQMFTLSNTSNDTLSGTLEVNMNSEAPFEWASTPYDNEGNGSTVSANGTGAAGLANYDWEIPRGGNTLNFYLKFAPGATAANQSWNGNVDPGGRDCAKIGLLGKVLAQDEGCTVSDLSLIYDGVVINPATPPTQTVTLTNPTDTTIGGTCSVGSTKSGFSITNGTPTGTSTASDNGDGTWDWQIKTTESIEWEITFDPSSAGTDSGAITWGEDETDSNCYTTGLIGSAYSTLFSSPSAVQLGNVPTNIARTVNFSVHNHGRTSGGHLTVAPLNGSDWYVVDTGGGSVAPSSTYNVTDFFADGANSHEVQVVWTPTSTGAFASSPVVRLYDSTIPGTYTDVALSGYAYDPQGCFLSSDGSSLLNAFNVGDVLVGGASATQDVKVYNKNSEDIRLTPETAGTAGWTEGSTTYGGSTTLSGGVYTVPTNGWVSVEMDLDQTAAGNRGVQVAKVNFGEQCQDSATLMGRVVAPRDIVDVNPTGLEFSCATTTTTDTQTVTLYNTSDSATITGTVSLSVAGGETNYYTIDSGGTLNISPGTEHPIQVTVDPDGESWVPMTFLVLGGTGDDLEGMYVPMGVDITDSGRDSNWDTLTDGSDADSLHTHTLPLANASDVTVSAPADGDLLTYKSAGSNWINQAPNYTYNTISNNDSNTNVTGAELEELTDGSVTALHGHKYRYPIDFGQRNTGGSDYWDTYALVSGYAGYRATTTGSAGSVVELSFTCEISGYSSAGNFECEIYAGQLGASATMIKEEVTAITGTGYIQVSQTYAPGTYTFNANDMIALYGRLTGGVTAWRYGVY